jgi:3-oxoadipate enol-lactonase
VLCNSLGADLHMWDPLVPALAARYRVLRHDARGHGASPATPGPYTVELLAQDVAQLVGAAGLVRPHVVGLSLGGMVALRLAADAPGLVASLSLCNTAARMPRPEAYQERIRRVRVDGLPAVVDAALALWFTPRFRDAHPEVVERARAMILGTSAEGYVAACAAVRDADLRGVLSGIGVPTLVVVGTADTATPPTAATFLAETIPGARYLELPVAHLSAMEAGSALAWELLTFLEQLEGGAAEPSGSGPGSFTGGVTDGRA